MSGLSLERALPGMGGARIALAVAAVLAAALFGSHLYAWTRVVALSQAVATAQGESFGRSFMASRAAWSGRPTREDLTAFLAAERDGGLVYVALVEPEGEVVMDAGTPAHAPTAADIESLRRAPMVVGENRWLLLSHSPGRHPGPPDGLPAGPSPDAPPEGPPDGPPDGPTDGRFGGEGRPPPPQLLVEYTPTLAQELRATAAGNLALSLVAGVALLGGALALVRSARVTADARASADRSRHMAALGEMSAVLAHEIRNPLAALKGHAQLLEEQVTGPAAVKARKVVAEATRLETITNELLDFARTNRLDRAPADALAVAREVAEEVAPGRVIVEGAAPPWPMDVAKVKVALRNLVRNAAQSDDSGGPIQVLVATVGGRLGLMVRDHGPGFSVEALPQAFAPFFTTRVNGAGLGLAVVRRIADLHGGEVVARNHPDGGAEVTLWLPEGG